jgi:NADH:ubiquinone oxidoreductase subunit H
MSAAGLRGVARVAFDLLPLVIVLAAIMTAVVALTGAMDLGELVHAQGGAPWRFAATQKPAAAMLAWVHCATVVTVLRVREGVHETAASKLTAKLGLLCASALAVAVFFGGWQVPGAAMTRTFGAQALGAGIFVVKTWALTAALAGAARVSVGFRPRDARSFALRRLVPGMIAAAALVVLSRRFAPSAALETACGATAVTVGFLVVVRCAARVRAVLLRPEAHASPFL